MGELRKIKENELKDLHRFEKKYVGSHESFEEFEQRFEKWPDTFVVYTENGDIIAGASGKLEGERKMGLQSIGVRDGFKGKGLGSKILGFFEENAKKYADIVTIASADNIEGFYRNNDYEPNQIMLQVKKENLPTNYREENEIVDEKNVGEDTKFLYADFDEYSEDLRNRLKDKFNAYEVNTIYEKEV